MISTPIAEKIYLVTENLAGGQLAPGPQPIKATNLRIFLKLRCHCNEKIVNPILIVKEQHLQIRLNSVFSFSISCFVSEIFRFLKHANYVHVDVIYSRIINYI